MTHQHACRLAIIVLSLLAVGCDAPPPDKPMETPLQPAPVRSPDAEADTLVTQLRYEIARDPVLRGAEIRISVTEGGMRLSGFVHSAAAKLRAAELANDMGGVPHIDNRLIVRRAGGLTEPPLTGIVIL